MATKGNLIIMLMTLLMLGHQTTQSGYMEIDKTNSSDSLSLTIDTSKLGLNRDNIKLLDSILSINNKIVLAKDSCVVKLTKLKKQQRTIMEKTEVMVNLNKKN
jgi:hypothetical protein